MANEIIQRSGTSTQDVDIATVTSESTGLVYPKESGNGIKIDTAASDWGWRDMEGPVVIRSTGATAPAWTTYQGNQNAFEFSVNDECQHTFHIPHDYAVGTDLYLHIHWSHNSATVTTGAPTFTYNVSYAKGHNQAAFSADVTGTISENASTTQYQHMITEVQLSAGTPGAGQLDSDDIEVDGLILLHTALTANTMDGGALPFVHFIDIHYQSTNIPTKGKAPNFYL